MRRCRRLDRHHQPLRVERIRKALAEAHELFGLVVEGHRNQEPVPRKPRPRDAFLALILLRRRIDPVGRAAQRKLAQRE